MIKSEKIYELAKKSPEIQTQINKLGRFWVDTLSQLSENKEEALK